MTSIFANDLRSAGWEFVRRFDGFGPIETRNTIGPIPSGVPVDPTFVKQFGIAAVVLYPGVKDFRIEISVQKESIVTHSAKLLVPAFSSVAHFESFLLQIITPLIMRA